MNNYQVWPEGKEKALVQLVCDSGGIQGRVLTEIGLFSRVLNNDANANNRLGWWGTTVLAPDGIRKGIRIRINHWKNNENAWREMLALYHCYDESIDAGVRRPQPPGAAHQQMMEMAGF